MYSVSKIKLYRMVNGFVSISPNNFVLDSVWARNFLGFQDFFLTFFISYSKKIVNFSMSAFRLSVGNSLFALSESLVLSESLYITPYKNYQPHL